MFLLTWNTIPMFPPFLLTLKTIPKSQSNSMDPLTFTYFCDVSIDFEVYSAIATDFCILFFVLALL